MPRNLMNNLFVARDSPMPHPGGLPGRRGLLLEDADPGRLRARRDATEAWIIATPNPVPAGTRARQDDRELAHRRRVPGQVYVSIGGRPEQLFSTNPSHQEATINSKDEYEFRLYAGRTTRRGWRRVKMTREPDRPGAQSPLDRRRRRRPR